jgi:hypothetical protein
MFISRKGKLIEISVYKFSGKRKRKKKQTKLQWKFSKKFQAGGMREIERDREREEEGEWLGTECLCSPKFILNTKMPIPSVVGLGDGILREMST